MLPLILATPTLYTPFPPHRGSTGIFLRIKSDMSSGQRNLPLSGFSPEGFRMSRPTCVKIALCFPTCLKTRDMPFPVMRHPFSLLRLW